MNLVTPPSVAGCNRFALPIGCNSRSRAFLCSARFYAVVNLSCFLFEKIFEFTKIRCISLQLFDILHILTILCKN